MKTLTTNNTKTKLSLVDFLASLEIKGDIRSFAAEMFVKYISLIEQKDGRKNALRKKVEDECIAKFKKHSGSNVWTWLVETFKAYISKPVKNTTANYTIIVSKDILVTDKWAIVNKKTREVVGYAPSKGKAYKAKQSDQVVKETVKL